jgi:hypothetical protein
LVRGFSRAVVSRDKTVRLSAGGLGCGDDFVEARITAQRIPARIELEIPVEFPERANAELQSAIRRRMPTDL